MISLDSNLLLYAFARNLPAHTASRRFLEALSARDDVKLSEFVLVELYRLLRLPALHARPLSAAAAVQVVQTYRRHPRWQVVGFTPDSAALHNALWSEAGRENFAFRRIYDARLALTLRHHGVTEFATANVKDFLGFGFKRVWNPLEEKP